MQSYKAPACVKPPRLRCRAAWQGALPRLPPARLPQVASFQCLQPFIGTVLAFLVLGEMPTWWDLGAVGIVAGLLLIVKDSRDLEPHVVRLKRLMSRQNLEVLLQSSLGGAWAPLGRQAAAGPLHEV